MKIVIVILALAVSHAFADFDPSQFKGQFKGAKTLPKKVKGDDPPPPAKVSYMNKMSPVKGAPPPTNATAKTYCGASWIYSAMAVLEYWSIQNATAQAKAQILSDQSVLDCSGNTKLTCNSGHAFFAMNHTKNIGVADGTKYKWTGVKAAACGFKTNPVVYKLKGKSPCYGELEGDEETLKLIIAYYGPTVVAIAETDAFRNFKGTGIYEDAKCSKTALTTFTTVIGYDIDAKTKKPYWILKHSYGTTWGDKGYMKYLSGKNQCGIASLVVVPC